MKPFDPSKDTLLIASDKKPITHRGVRLMVRVEKYKVAGPVHVVGALLPGTSTLTVERDQNRAAAMRRIKDAIDSAFLNEVYPLDTGVNGERLERSIAQLDAGQGVEHELIDPMAEVVLDDEERAGYIEGRF